MLGALSMNQRHLYELYKLMYPGSYTSTNTGGDPDVIPTMTQADLQAFHSTYYQPSNALIVLTGRTRSGAVSGADRRGLSERLRRADG